MVQGGSDTVVVNSVANADAIAADHAKRRGTSTLTLNSLGVVEEYQLNLSMNYTLTGKDGTVLIPPSVIALNRAMTYSDQFSQAKAAEADILFADMENDAIDQLMRRLAIVRRCIRRRAKACRPSRRARRCRRRRCDRRALSVAALSDSLILFNLADR